MLLIQVYVLQVSVFSQEPLAVLDSRRWLTSPLVLSIVVLFQLFQHSIQNKQLAAIQVPLLIVFITYIQIKIQFQKRPDFGMIGDHGQHAVLPVDFAELRVETEHVHLHLMDVHARKLLVSH